MLERLHKRTPIIVAKEIHGLPQGIPHAAHHMTQWLLQGKCFRDRPLANKCLPRSFWLATVAEDGLTLGGMMPSHARALATWRSGPNWSNGSGPRCAAKAVGPEGHVVPQHISAPGVLASDRRCPDLVVYSVRPPRKASRCAVMPRFVVLSRVRACRIAGQCTPLEWQHWRPKGANTPPIKSRGVEERKAVRHGY